VRLKVYSCAAITALHKLLRSYREPSAEVRKNALTLPAFRIVDCPGYKLLHIAPLQCVVRAAEEPPFQPRSTPCTTVFQPNIELYFKHTSSGFQSRCQWEPVQVCAVRWSRLVQLTHSRHAVDEEQCFQEAPELDVLTALPLRSPYTELLLKCEE
jgi:hypothetical protein